MRLPWNLLSLVLCTFWLNVQGITTNLDRSARPVSPSPEAITVVREGDILEISSQSISQGQEIFTWLFYGSNVSSLYVSCPDFPSSPSCDNYVLLVSANLFTSSITTSKFCDVTPSFYAMCHPLSAVYIKPFTNPDVSYRCLITTAVMDLQPETSSLMYNAVEPGALRPLENDILSGLPQVEIQDGLTLNGEVLCGSNTTLELDTLYVVHSPAYPSAYPANTKCTWSLQAPEDKKISFMCQDFNMPSCEQGDYLKFTYSPNEQVSYCGNDAPGFVISEGNLAELTFKGILSEIYRGFTCTLKVVSADEKAATCGLHSVTTDDIILITSPGFPRNFYQNSHSYWQFQAPAMHRLRVDCPVFDMSDDCTEDYLSFDLADGSGEKQVTCGKRHGFSLQSTGESLILNFVPQSNNVYGGFYCTVRATLEFLPPGTLKPLGIDIVSGLPKFEIQDGISSNNEILCGSNTTLDLDTLYVVHSPSHPKPFPVNIHCTWTLQAPKDKTLSLMCQDFNMPSCEQGGHLNFTYGSDKQLRYCGNNAPGLVTSEGSVAELSFMGGSNEDFRGFSCTVKVVSADETAVRCGLHAINRQSVTLITNPSFPRYFTEKDQCQWIFQSPAKHTIRMECPIFDMSENCSEDYLSFIFNDKLCEEHLVCGKRPGFVLESTGESLLLNFVPQSNSKYRGFYCTVRAFPKVTAPGVLKSLENDSVSGLLQVEIQDGLSSNAEILCGSNTSLELDTLYVIHSPSYPIPYPADTNCTWTLLAPEGKKVSLMCQDFNLPSCEQGDFLRFTYGTDQQHSYCGTDAPEFITSDGNKAELSFKGVSGEKLRGFSCTAKVVSANETPVRCGLHSVIRNETMLITSPGFPRNFTENSHCQWTFQAPPKHILRVDCPIFDMSANCSEDYFSFSFNESCEEHLACGKRPGFSFESTAESLILDFVPQSNNKHWGLFCNVRAFPKVLAAGTLKPLENDPLSGLPRIEIQDGLNSEAEVLCGSNTTLELDTLYVIHSPSYPSVYPENINCVWNLKTPQNKKLSFMCQDFHMPPCEKGAILNLTYGANGQSSYCGNDIPKFTTSDGNLAILSFSGGSNKEFRGFTCTVKVVAADETAVKCGSHTVNRKDTLLITSPEFPRNFTEHSQCEWTFQSPAKHTISVNCPVFDMSDNCTEDYLSYSVPDDATQNQVLCGKRPDFSLESTGESLTLNFVPRSNNAYRGLYCTVQATPKAIPYGTLKPLEHDRVSGLAQIEIQDGFSSNAEVLCGSNTTLAPDTLYVIHSPSYPKPYPADAECYWQLHAPEDKKLSIMCQDFDMPSCDQGDYLDITHGLNSYTKYCGNNAPEFMTSAGNLLELDFKGTANDVMRGFTCTVKVVFAGESAVKCGSHSIATNDVALIATPGFPRTFTQHSTCQWKFQAPEKHSIRLDCPVLEMSDNCTEDYLSYAFNDENSEKICGKRTGYSLQSTGNSLFLDFVPQSVHLYRGLFCTVTATPIPSPPGALQPLGYDTLSGLPMFEIQDGLTSKGEVLCGSHTTLELDTIYTIHSPLYPKQYPQNSECSWKIEVPQNKKVSLMCQDFDMPPCDEGDYLSFTYGPNQQMKYCGNNTPEFLISEGNSAELTFKGGSNKTFRGFTCTVKAVSAVKTAVRCGVQHVLSTNDVMIITTPGYPRNFTRGSICSWMLKAPESYTLRLDCPVFEMSADCTEDSISNFKTDKSYERFCGHVPGFSYQSTENYFYLVFNPQSENLHRGLYCTVRAVPQAIASGSLKPLENDTVSGLPQLEIQDGLDANGEVLCGSNTTLELDTIYVIHSPSYPNRYPQSAQCDWKLEAPQDKKLSFMCQDFHMPPCDAGTYLNLSYGLNRQTKYCGDKAPEFVTSEGNMVQLTFMGGRNTEFRGFSCTVKVVSAAKTARGCGLYSVGSQEVALITSPGYPRKFDHRSRCRWVFQAPEGHSLRLDCPVFEMSDNCTEDYLSHVINDKTSENFCGKLSGYFLESTTEVLFLDFFPQSVNLFRGLYCTVKPVRKVLPPGTLKNLANDTLSGLPQLEIQDGIDLKGDVLCGSNTVLMPDTLYVVHSPKYPQPYPENIQCKWKLQAPLGKKISFMCHDFHMPPCEQGDSLKFIDGSIRNLNYCGEQAPELVSSLENAAELAFSGAIKSEFRGFTCTAKVVPGDTTIVQCGFHILTTSQETIFMTSPGFPRPFTADKQCEWVFQAPEEHILRVECPILDFSQDCSEDYFSYARLEESYQPQRICGKQFGVSLQTEGRFILLNFVPQSNNAYRGVFCTVRADPKAKPLLEQKPISTTPLANNDVPEANLACNQQIVLPDMGMATITTPGYPGNYAAGTNCSWKVETEDGHFVLMSCFETNLPDNCGDRMLLRVSKNPSAKPWVVCKNNASAIYISKTSRLSVEFQGNADKTHSGFKCAVMSIAQDIFQFLPCNNRTTLRTSQDVTIVSPFYPSKIPRGSSCTWNFTAPPLHQIRLFCPLFNISDGDTRSNDCADDVLSIRNTQLNRTISTCGKGAFRRMIRGNAASIVLPSVQNPRSERLLCFVRAIPLDPAALFNVTPPLLDPLSNKIAQNLALRSHHNCPLFAYSMGPNSIALATSPGQHYLTPGTAEEQGELKCYTRFTSTDANRQISTVCNVNRLSSDCRETVSIKYLGSDKDSIPFCGNNLTSAVTHTGSKEIEVRFVSPAAPRPETQFQCYAFTTSKDIKYTPCDTTTKLTNEGEEVYITTPTFPNGYTEKDLCSWKFETDEALGFNLFCPVFDLPTMLPCGDRLVIANGTSTRRYCSKQPVTEDIPESSFSIEFNPITESAAARGGVLCIIRSISKGGSTVVNDKS